MDIQTVTVEFLRAGPRHNQLLSPITPYLGVCEKSEASRVTLPYEHAKFERRLRDLRYALNDPDDKHRASHVLDETGREIAELLGSIKGVASALDPSKARPEILTHLRIVLSASELDMLPFEASKVPTVSSSSAGSPWLALRSQVPVCVTRQLRSSFSGGTSWPTEPRVLFIAGPDTPIREHQQALEKALHPWRDLNDSVGQLLQRLESPSIDQITQALSAAAAANKPITHVHILAHGTQIDDRDRYSAVGLVLNEGEPILGDLLASAFTSCATWPTVVTLASCDSGQQVDVRTADASIAHDLHESGIPLVIASQFPLTVEGSIPFVTRFYQGQLRGEHPVESLYEVRRAMRAGVDADTHDWASLVVYEALPPDLSTQLEDVCYWQSRRALEGAFRRLESIAQNARDGIDVYAERMAALKSVEDEVAELPTSGPYALECAGLRASAQKRMAVAVLESVAAGEMGERDGTLLDECRKRLQDARSEYWRASKAFVAPSMEQLRKKSNLHWLLGQVISLDVVLGQPIDQAHLAVATLAAQIDLEDSSKIERAWAHVSLTEFSLLRLTDTSLDAQREDIANKALEHARAFLDLVGFGSEHAFTACRQFDRYVSWWGNPLRQPLFDKLGIPEHPHWHVEHGFVPAARRVVALLRGGMRARPGENALPAMEVRAASVVRLKTRSTSPEKLAQADRPADQILAVEMLPAENGDCLLLEYGDRTKRFRVLIDCGAGSSVPVLARRLGAEGAKEPLPFDLFVLTHIDADHINGVLTLFDEQNVKLSFADIWFNGWRQINRFLGVRKAEEFSKLLEDTTRKLPWNRAFTQQADKYPGPVVVADRSELPTLALPGGMQLTLLSPGRAQLQRLAKVWQQALVDLDPKKAKEFLGRRTPPAKVTDYANFDLKSLADSPVRKDPSAANGSSIALLAEFAGRSVLLTGDAHADVLANSIGVLQRARGRAGDRLKVDALKLSHHGSANATTLPLLDAIECEHYLVSTNGKHFYHPDRESIARVILYGGPQPTLHFNYRSDYNGLWDDDVLKKRYRYVARYPKEETEGLRVEL